MKMQLESRPRTNGLKFGISVGGLSLVDKMTPNSILPTLIRPQVKVRVRRLPVVQYRLFGMGLVQSNRVVLKLRKLKFH